MGWDGASAVAAGSVANGWDAAIGVGVAGGDVEGVAVDSDVVGAGGIVTGAGGIVTRGGGTDRGDDGERIARATFWFGATGPVSVESNAITSTLTETTTSTCPDTLASLTGSFLGCTAVTSSDVQHSELGRNTTGTQVTFERTHCAYSRHAMYFSTPGNPGLHHLSPLPTAERGGTVASL